MDLLSRVRQDNLISYFAFDQDVSTPFFVREWLHGFSLLDLLRWKGVLQPTEMVELLSGIAETLDFATQYGLGLFEFTLLKSFVVCSETVESARFRELARGQFAGLADCRLKLNPLS
jgi:hypothetical protein